MTRHLARETALQMLFQVDLGQNEADMTELTVEEAGLAPAYSDFSRQLFREAWQHKEELDNLVSDYCCQWELDRLANVDRNILRLAAYELRYQQETPAQVVINEAIELAKSFSTAESGAFINGILDNIRKAQSAL